MDRPVTIALVVAAVLTVQPGLPGAEALGALVAIGIVLALATRWQVAPIALAVLLVIGVALRAAVQIPTLRSLNGFQQEHAVVSFGLTYLVGR